METITLYLIKSTVWLTGFSLIYFLFLRNERFFVLNRIYLVSGILGSIIFPLFTWHYTVVFPVVPMAEVLEPQVQGIVTGSEPFPTQNLLLFIYLAGALYLILRLIKQTVAVWKVIRESETYPFKSVKLIRTDRYPASFSFFSFVFVNPSIDETETNEIVNHEQEHIRQQHWVDLLLFEILRTMQWFNPVSWLYGHFIRQNHEFLADERALQRTTNPAIYRAALLNQMFGGPVIQLANSFNYSLNKKRFNMMKQTINSPFRKLKLLLVVPLIAGVFYAFATPEYKFVQAENSNSAQQVKRVTGKVVGEDGVPLKSATIIVAGKTIGTVTDANGNFKLEMPDDSPLFISYVGFESQKIAPDFSKEMAITLKRKTFSIEFDKQASETGKTEQTDLNKSKAMIVVDGKEISKADMDKLPPDKVESVSVLKGESATKLYGEKGKDGVVVVTLKSDNQKPQTYKVQTDSPLKFGNSDGFGPQPLYLKDGMTVESKDIQSIDPESIQSINILKGEQAIAKFGNKGKNGAIEITMKKASDVFRVVEEMPEFPGGVEALKAFIKATIQYPAAAFENGIQGKVYVNFVVTKTGSVAKAKVVRGVDPLLDKEAIRVVEAMPNWNPGKQNGENVDVFYTVPVDFVLPTEEKN